MKKIFFTIIVLALSQSIQALSIQELSASPSNQDILVHLKVFEGHYFEYNNYSYSIDGEVITLNICYTPITLSIITTKENDFIIPDVNSASFNYTLIVNVNYRNWNGSEYICEFNAQSDTETIQFSTPLSATVTLSSSNFLENHNKLKLFPNPTSGIIEFPVDYISMVRSIKIYDNIGRLIKACDNSISNAINLGSLVDGIYLIEITTDTEKAIQKIVLKK